MRYKNMGEIMNKIREQIVDKREIWVNNNSR